MCKVCVTLEVQIKMCDCFHRVTCFFLGGRFVNIVKVYYFTKLSTGSETYYVETNCILVKCNCLTSVRSVVNYRTVVFWFYVMI